MILNASRFKAHARGRGERPLVAGRCLAAGVVLLAVGSIPREARGQLVQRPSPFGQQIGLLAEEDRPGHDDVAGFPQLEPSWPPSTGLLRRSWGSVGDYLPQITHPPEGRHRGVGDPLICESWRYRPFSAGWCMGMMQGGPLIDDWVGGNQGFFGGYRFGWDFDHYWGCEMRFSFGTAALYDSQRAKEAQRAADDAGGLPPNDPFRARFDGRRDCTASLWDVDFLYYPWGDAAWRPYVMAGLGTARIRFVDRLSTRYDQTVLGLPVAIGLKYLYSDWVALRVELADNVAFGQSFNTVHHLSLTGGMEVRFGGRRVAYWPWRPGRHYW